MKLTYTRKTTLAFSSLSALCLVVGVVGFLANRTLINDLELMSRTVLPATDTLLQLDRDMHQTLIAQLTLSSGAPELAAEALESANENTAQVLERWRSFQSSVSQFSTNEMNGLGRSFEKDYESWKSVTEQSLQLLMSADAKDRAVGIALAMGEGMGRFDSTRAHVDQLTDLLDAQAEALRDHSEATAARARATLILVVLACVGIGGVLTWQIGIIVGRRLKSIALDLASNANSTADAASQIFSNSQRVADGASEQAAALEETSASLEESSTMIQSSAEAAHKIKAVSEATNKAAQEGYEEMASMVEAMQLIDQSSDNISSTLKTIDEIAFQTNILALNAAVEAARAGSAGAGFAVVADEVRALAQRCAKAARETSSSIEESAQRTEMGIKASGRVSEKLTLILQKAGEMDQLMASMASMSQEQAIGINQLNKALSQMDHATQSNAASSEETASAASELDGQAAQLDQMVAMLSDILGLETDTHSSVRRSKSPSARASRSSKRAAPSISRPSTGGRVMDEATAYFNSLN